MAELTPLGGTPEKPDISMTNVKMIGPAEQQPAPEPQKEVPAQPPVESGGEAVPPVETPDVPEETAPPEPEASPGAMTAGIKDMVGKVNKFATTPTAQEIELQAARAARLEKEYPGVVQRLSAGEFLAGGQKRFFDLHQLQNPQQLQALIDDVAAGYRGVLAKVKRGVITDEQLQALATETGMTEKELQQTATLGMLEASQHLAARRVMAAAGQRVISTIDEMRLAGAFGTDPAAERVLLEQYAIFRDISAKTLGIGSEVARSLRATQVPIQGMQDATQLAEMGSGIYDPTGKGQRRVINMLSKFQSVEQMSTFARLTSAVPNAFVEAWVNSILSGPQTQAANLTGNIAVAINGVLERQVAGVWGAAFAAAGRERGVYMDEAAAMLMQSRSAMSDSLRAAARMMTEGESTFNEISQPGKFADKFDTKGFKRAISAEAFGMSGVPGNFVNGVGTFINLPTKFLVSTDEFFKVFNFQMALRAEAEAAANAAGLHGKEWQAAVAQAMTDPTTFKSAWDASRNYAKYTTFNRELGGFGQAIRAASTYNSFTRMINPFTTAPANIAFYTFERFPAINLLGSELRADLRGLNGARRRDQAFAKVSVGAGAAAVVAGMVYSGYMTGRGPLNPILRKQLEDVGWKPYSVWDPVNKEYIALDRTDPLGAFLMAVADTTQIATQLPEHDAMNLAAGVVTALGGVMLNKTYMQSFAQLVQAMEESSRGNPESPTVKTWVNSYAGSVIPQVVATGNKAYLDPQIKDIRRWQDAIYARIPGWSKDVAPKRDVYGRPRLYEGGWGLDIASPMAVSKVKDEPGLMAMSIHQVAVQPLSRTLVGPQEHDIQIDPAKAQLVDGVTLTDKEYDRWGQILETMKVGGKTLKEKLDSMAVERGWLKDPPTTGTPGPQGTIANDIKNQVLFYRAMAQQKLRQESRQNQTPENPSIDKRIQQYWQERGKKLNRNTAIGAEPGAQQDAGTGISAGIQRLTR